MTFKGRQLQEISEREREIIALLAEGLTNNEIADRIFLSKNTVKWYVQQLNQKLYTASREEIVAEAERLGLLAATAPEATRLRPQENLPRQTTPFVGRDAELEELHTILAKGEIRLLTLLAPGGMGKTRIALELLEQQVNHFSDGVYFVPLQPLSDVDNIILQIAASAGYQFSADGRELKQQVLDFLSNKRSLLLLDSFEHLLTGAELVNDILQAAPGVKVIVTSREKLSLLGETVYVLPGMRFPTRERPDATLGFDAVQLLLDAAQRVKPDWTVNEHNVDDVARVCRLTEGMPLGILLAASWLDVYSLGRICDEIEKSADILETEMRDVPERQRSIRAVFGYSWERLKPAEQAALMKMSVFRGGCTPEAAEAITGASGRILHGLVNKALLSRNRAGRYDIHELLRQYAYEHLQQADVADQSRTDHMRYYAHELRKREAHLKDSRQIEALSAIEADFDNLRAAWHWAIAHNHLHVLNETVEAMRMFVLLANRVDSGAELLLKAIKHLQVQQDHYLILAKLKCYYADALINLDHFGPAQAMMDECEALLREAGDSHTKALMLVSLCRIRQIAGLQSEALELAEAYLAASIELDDAWHIAQAHYGFCIIGNKENLHSQLTHVGQCLKVASRVGDRYWLGHGYALGGLVNRGLGNLDEAQEQTNRAYKYHCEIHNKSGMATALNNLAELAKTTGDWIRCEQLHREALAMAQDLSYSNNVAWQLCKLAASALIRGDLAYAEKLAQASAPITRALNYPPLSVLQTTTMSMIVEYKGDYLEAYRLAHQAFEHTQSGVNWSAVYAATERLGWTLCCLDDYDAALPHLIQTAKKDMQMNGSWPLLKVLAAFSMIATHNGNPERAVEMLGLVFQHVIQSVWLNRHPKLLALRDQLKDGLDEAAYSEAWERGKKLDARTVLDEVLSDFLAGSAHDSYSPSPV